MKPLFMWAGGKSKLIKNKYKDFLPTTFNKYVEPFFGGGAMFVYAYKTNPDAEFIINDVNKDIMNIYKVIRDDVDDFIEKLDQYQKEYIPLDKESRKEYYYNLRTRNAFDYENLSTTESAALMYTLLKLCFNGIWQINKNTNNRFGTPAGLLNQKTKIYDKENVMEWHQALQNCIILNGDYKDTFDYIDSSSFVFMDPPYRGSFTNYGTQSDDEFQKEVLSFFEECCSKGSLSYLSNRDIGDGFYNLSDYTVKHFDITYTAGRRKKTEKGFEAKKAVEFLVFCPESS